MDTRNNLLELGAKLLEEGHFDKAAEVFERCLASSILPSKSNAGLGWCALLRGHDLQASRYFQKSLKYSNEWAAQAGLGKAYMRLKRVDLAINHLKSGLKLMETADVLEDLGNCLLKKGKYRQSILFLSKAASYAESLDILNGIGYAHECLDELDAALSAYQKSVRIRHSLNALNGIIRIQCRKGDLDGAISAHELCRKKSILRSLGTHHIATLAINKGDVDLALKYLSPVKAHRGLVEEARMLSKVHLSSASTEIAYKYAYIFGTIEGSSSLFDEVVSGLLSQNDESVRLFLLDIPQRAISLDKAKLERLLEIIESQCLSTEILDSYLVGNQTNCNKLQKVVPLDIKPEAEVISFDDCFWQNRVSYSFGDSHSQIFSLLPQVKRFPLNAPTAFNIFKIGSTSRSREIIENALKKAKQKPTTIILTFGEIDIREHVFNQAIEQVKPVREIIFSVIENYFSMISRLVSDGYEVIVNGPHAVGQFKGFPSELEKQLACSFFNFLLNEKCKSIDVKYVTLFDKVVDLLSMRKREELFCDANHLHRPDTAMGANLQRLLLDRIESGNCEANSNLYQNGFPMMASVVLTDINGRYDHSSFNCSMIDGIFDAFDACKTYFLILRVYTLSPPGILSIKLADVANQLEDIEPILTVYTFDRRHDLMPQGVASCKRLARLNSEVCSHYLREDFQCHLKTSDESDIAYLVVTFEHAQGLHLSGITIQAEG